MNNYTEYVKSFVDFETAKKLKEKHYNQEVYINSYWYSPTGEFCMGLPYKEVEALCPRLCDVQQWLIKNWNIHVYPICETEVDSYGNVIGYHYDCEVKYINLHDQSSYTQSLEKCNDMNDAILLGIKLALTLI